MSIRSRYLIQGRKPSSTTVSVRNSVELPPDFLSPEPFILGTHPRHLELLIRLANQHPRAAHALLPDVLDDGAVAVSSVLIGPLVEASKAEARDFPDDGGAQPRAFLTDPSREDEGVDFPAERDVVRADVSTQAVDKQVEGEAAGRVVLPGGRVGDEAEVGGARQGLPPGLLVEDLLGTRDVQVPRRGRRELASVGGVVEDQAGEFRGWRGVVSLVIRGWVRRGKGEERAESKTNLGSTLPLLVAPGSPASGVRPMLVSQLLPPLMAHALAPEPRCSAIRLTSSGGLPRKSAAARVMKA